nr:helix-turn-helix domain-containing protein [Pseudonocardia acaciae]
MSERRERVLAVIQGAGRPVGVAEVAERVGVHANTARFHLEALVDDGVIDRITDAPSGRGRPPISYRARPGLARGGTRRYRLLAEILLSHLAAGDEPAGSATGAGRLWGAHLVARPVPGHTVDAEEAVDRLVTMLDELDFAPERLVDRSGAGRIRLRHCPFLELAEPHRDLVCKLHLGLMQGALDQLGAPIVATDLRPFAEPTACLADLEPAAR